MPSINPFPERLPDDKAQKIAEKRTATLKEQAGMFAEYVDLVTPEMVQAGVKAHHDAFNTAQQRLELRAAVFREEVEKHITQEELAGLLERLSVLPDCPAYRADFWRRELNERGLPVPT